MVEVQRTYNLNGNKLVYTETGETVVPRRLENKTKGIIIETMYSPTREGIMRFYDGGGNEQSFTQNYYGKSLHPDYDFVEFTFKKGNEPSIAINSGRLYKDGTFTIENIKQVGERINSKGKKVAITQKISIDEANKLIEEFKVHINELSPRIRRVLNKIKSVKVV